jgi:hypothetical protein
MLQCRGPQLAQSCRRGALQHFPPESRGHLTLGGRGTLRIVLASATQSIASSSDADLPPMHEVVEIPTKPPTYSKIEAARGSRFQAAQGCDHPYGSIVMISPFSILVNFEWKAIPLEPPSLAHLGRRAAGGGAIEATASLPAAGTTKPNARAVERGWRISERHTQLAERAVRPALDERQARLRATAPANLIATGPRRVIGIRPTPRAARR